MRKIVFTCDMCGAERKSQDIWVICWTSEKETRLTVAYWTNALANREDPDLKYLCSPGCQMKLLTRFFDRAKGIEVERRIKADDPPLDDDDEDIE